MASDINKFHFRLVLLGANETGKTAILNRFLFKKFEDKYKPTVEDLFSKEFDLGSIELKVDFLDTSGSMQFPAMRRLSITTGDAFMIVYALDDENSYEVVKLCMAEIQEIRPDFQEIPIVFVGNKSDTPREKRKVSKEQVSNYAYYELPRLRTKVVECSCRDNVNIETIFRSYLSLARVSVSSTVISQTNNNNNNNHSHHHSLTNKKRPASTIPAESNHSSSASSRCGSSKELNESGQQQQQQQDGDSSCGASIKVALGVRKSCDASIVSSMRKVSLSASSRSSRDQLLESMCESDQQQQQQQIQVQVHEQQPTGTLREHQQTNNNNNNNNNNHGQPPPPTNRRLNQKSSIESLLKDANRQQLSSRLSVGGHQAGGAKPRSRSLIWRPHRKSSQRAAQNDASECRVT